MFALMLLVLHLAPPAFRAGFFIESFTTQTSSSLLRGHRFCAPILSTRVTLWTHSFARSRRGVFYSSRRLRMAFKRSAYT
jgi:hypothetical protein